MALIITVLIITALTATTDGNQVPPNLSAGEPKRLQTVTLLGIGENW
jgi:hypothetical protein